MKRPQFPWIIRTIIIFVGMAGHVASAQPYGLDSRPVIGPFLNNTLPASAPFVSGDFSAVVAFTNLVFTNALGLTAVPGTNRLCVWEREGRVYTFSNASDTTQKTLVLDISNQCQGWDDSGLLGLAFHPGFITNRYMFVYYTWVVPGTVQGNPTTRPPAFATGAYHDRLSRFTLDLNGVAIPTSEMVLVDQIGNSVWHNGGGMFFHPLDGFLYWANGDDVNGGNAQVINQNLFAGVFRIDVDQRGGAISHPPPRQPANGTTANYFIPNSNPFVGQPGVLEEFFCLGLRSPHRMTIDPPSSRIFIGDVGESSREEVSIIEPGESALNFQWNRIEGLNGDLTPPYIGINRRPVLDYTHSEGFAVIGGYVYRGSEFATDLGGKYIFGDNGSRTVWVMDEVTTPARKIALCTVPLGSGPSSGEDYTGLSSFGLDADGEIYMCQMSSVGGRIYKLARSERAGGQSLPALLSQTGVFTNLTTLAPAPGLIPYDVNSPLWSDGAHKTRWLALPTNTFINFATNGEWSFPVGAVFVKNFELSVNDTNLALRRRLETRLLARDTNGHVYGATYKWRPDLSDADLVLTSTNEDITITTATGTRIQTWSYPGRQDCLRCHTLAAGGVLGVKTRQLNGDFNYTTTGATDNQIRAWNHIGLFGSPVNEAEISGYSKLVPVTDTNATIEFRARSYLDANCSHCHRPGGVNALFDARIDTPLPSQGLINGQALNPLGIAGAKIIVPSNTNRSVLFLRDSTLGAIQMPPLARNVVDAEAMAVIAEWIDTVEPNPPPAGLVAHWKFDEGVNTSAADASSNGYTGTLVNGANWAVGQAGSAVNLDGVNDYVSVPNLDVTDSGITLAAWVNLASLPTDRDVRFISKASNATEAGHWWMLGHTFNGDHRLRFRLKTGGVTTTLIASGYLTANTWVHAAATYDGTTMRLYLNGAEVGSTAKTGAVDVNAAVAVNLGRNPDGSNHLPGQLDEVRIYKRGLSQAEVQQIMSDFALIDTTSPTVVHVGASDATTVQVLFSEPVTAASAQTVANYSINNGVTIFAAALGADMQTVTLTVSTLDGGNYMLSVNNVEDRATPPNSIAANSQANFDFTLDTTSPTIASVTAVSAATVQVQFSEPVTTASAQIVANYSINNGVTVSAAVLEGDTRTVTLTTSILTGGDYALTVSNVADLADPPNAIAINSQAAFTFNPDPTPPSITNVAAVDSTTVRVSFSELVATDSAQNPANYDIGDGVTVTWALLDTDDRTVTLITSPLAGGNYILTVNNVTDRAPLPNPIAPNSETAFSFTPPSLGEITLDSATFKAETDNNNSASLILTQGALTSGYVLVGVSMYDPATASSITSATYGGTAMTLLGTVQSANAYTEVYLFGLAVGNKAAGNYTVALTGSTGIDQLIFGAAAFSNVRQTTSTGPFASSTGWDTAPSVNASSVSGDLVVDILGHDSGSTTLGANQTQIWKQEDTTDRTDGVSSRESATGATTTISYTKTVSAPWSIGAVALKSGGAPPADTTPPIITLLAAINANTVQVLFSEPVTTASARAVENYGINNGVTIFAAALGADTRTVNLTTSTIGGGAHTLTINNVADLGSPPNLIAPNTQTDFTFIANEAPFAVADSYSVTEDTAFDLGIPGVLGNDADGDDDTLTAILVTGPLHGSLALEADGSFNFIPDADYNGPDSFTYRAFDGITNSAPATVSIAVLPVNDMPLAVNNTYSVNEATVLTVTAPGVLANDGEVDGDTLTAVLETGPLHGTLTFNSDGSFTYIPTNNYNGPDSFTYYALDAVTNSVTATVNISIMPVNDAPLAVDDNFNMNEDDTLVASAPGLLGNDSDADGNSLTALLQNAPQHGTLNLKADGSFTYTPAKSFNGLDSFSYHALDGITNSGAATVSITIAPVNDAPISTNDAYMVNGGSVLDVAAPGVLANDTDVDGDTLTAVLEAAPLHGTLTFNGNGSFTYVPTNNYNGPDAFTYRALDGFTNSETAEVNINVLPADFTPPLILNVIATNAHAVQVLFSEPVEAASAQTLTHYAINNGVTISNAVLASDARTVTLTTSTLFGGDYVLTVNNVTDLASPPNLIAAGSHALFTIVVNAPVAVNDDFSLGEDGALNVSAPGVLANDTDVDDDVLAVALETGPLHGSIVLNADGSFDYTPVGDYHGRDGFTYRTLDGITSSAPATVTITVTPVNDAPVAVNEAINTDEDATLVVSAPGVLGNDTDADGDLLTAVLLSGAMHGSLTLNADGGFTYAPSNNYAGLDNFTYRALDGATNSVAATVSISVHSLNDVPLAVSDNYSVTQAMVLSINAPGVLANDTDADGDTLTAVLETPPLHGTLTFNGNGSLTYTPTNNYSGPDSFTYRALDAATNSDPATVSITVVPADSTPPTISSVTAGSATTVSVSFSEQVEVGLAQSLVNYNINNDVTIITAVLEGDMRTVTLTTSTLAGGDHILTVNNVTDRATPPNPIAPGSQALFNFTPNPLPLGLIAHWRFDEGSGTSAVDASGNGHTGTLVNGAGWAVGQAGSAVNLDGINDYVSVPNLDVTDSGITLTAWVNLANLPTSVDARIISKASNASESGHWWMLSHTFNGNHRLRFRLKTGGVTTTLIAGSGNLAANTWFHAAATYDGSTMRLYLNGIEVGSTAKTGALDVNPAIAVNLGRNPEGSNRLPGRLDEVRIYERGLSEAEIQQIMNDTAPAPTIMSMAAANTDIEMVLFSEPDSMVVNVTAKQDLPAPWQTANVGNLSAGANTAHAAAVFTVQAAGNISGSADICHYVYQTLSADGEIRARVYSQQNTGVSARAGVMIRENLNENAAHAMMNIAPDGTFRFERRTSTGHFTSSTTSSGGTFPDTWVRLVRSGNTITGYQSQDGTLWTQVSSTSITMASNIYIGVAVVSGSSGTLNTSVFDNVTVVP